MKLNNPLKLIIALGLPLFVGWIGSLFTAPAIPVWYNSLVKPTLNPPNWIFAPVWTLLFILMGIAAFLVWRKGLKKKEVKLALAIFVFQLLLNSFWSMLFFGMHNLLVSFTEILSLWFAIMALLLAFYQVSRAAAYLIVPYVLWTSFAVYLNYAIWQLSIR